MEPITHFLTGACLSRAGFNRKTALATATMTLTAEAPDLDVFGSFKGPVYGFAHHRGFTHSFLGLVLVSAVVTGFMYVVWRFRGRKTNIPDLPPRWGLLFLFAYIAGLSHILLDYTNNYGVRPFWPFWEKWYSWNIAFILEPPMLLILLAGLVLSRFVPAGKRLAAGQLFAKLALLSIVVLWGVRYYERTNAEHVLRSETFRSATFFDSEKTVRASAFPYWTPDPRTLIALHWAAVVETQTSFVTSAVNPWTGKLDPAELVIIAKPPQTPAILAAEQSYLGRVYLDWAGYPLVTESSEGDDTVVLFRDLRFGYPQLRRDTLLTATVQLDRNLHVTVEAMGPRKQNPPID